DETLDELGAEFHKKLDLKDEDERVAENEKKGSNFVDSSGEYGGEELGGEESEVDKVSGDFDVDGDGNGDDEVEVEGDEKIEKKKDRSSGRV
ncbi:hypothetical protein HN51_024680, partial [Arachis hypogaea]